MPPSFQAARRSGHRASAVYKVAEAHTSKIEASYAAIYDSRATGSIFRETSPETGHNSEVFWVVPSIISGTPNAVGHASNVMEAVMPLARIGARSAALTGAPTPYPKCS
jgi:hypothetical protein